MTFEKLKALIDRYQGEAGTATGGNVDALVYSGLDVHNMLNEISDELEGVEETYAPKIKIPKWVADELEENGLIITQFNRIFFLHDNVSFHWPYSDELKGYAKSYEGYRNISAYLNELTRKFVEVIE